MVIGRFRWQYMIPYQTKISLMTSVFIFSSKSEALWRLGFNGFFLEKLRLTYSSDFQNSAEMLLFKLTASKSVHGSWILLWLLLVHPTRHLYCAWRSQRGVTLLLEGDSPCLSGEEVKCQISRTLQIIVACFDVKLSKHATMPRWVAFCDQLDQKTG